MRFLPLVILIPLTTLLSCTNETEVVPVADFQLVDATTDTPHLTYETLTVTNTSQNGVRFTWDFGNGTTSTEREPTFSYPTSGTYTVKLIVESEDGFKRTQVREITVLDRVLKQLTLTALSLADLEIAGIDNTSSVDVFLTIKQVRTKEGVATNQVVYQSSPVNLSPSEVPHTFTVAEKVIFDPSLLNANCLSFMIQASIDGQTYVVGSSLTSGGSFGQWTIPGSPLAFATTFTGGSFTMACDYE